MNNNARSIYQQTELFQLFVMLVFSLLFLTACDAGQNSSTSQAVAGNVASVGVQSSVNQSTVTPTSTLQATTIPVSSSTATSVSALVSPTRAGTNQDWQYNWLRGIPCKAPCFENIIPGVTTIEKAEAILKTNSLVVDVSNFSLKRRLVWNWKYNTKNILGSFYAAFALYNSNRPDEVITAIDPSLEINFTLNDVIKTYGQPSHVQIVARPDYEHIGKSYIYNFDIVYLPQGFVVKNREGTKKPVISGELSFETVVFFVANNFRTYPYPIFLVPWQGFKSFEFYCLAAYPSNDICSK